MYTIVLKVLSQIVSEALKFTSGNECCETALFIEKMDKFFDSFNVSSFSQGKKAWKPFQQPYRKPKSEDHEDFRLKVYMYAG